ncbi:hypothetical protein D0544_01345 [Aestuariirhabdus litorea]|uniref:Uncharacterized protein n=1 Tax=Aestuariirhabdus litorea TaxID=2528527 RepID=A0A3P3VM31_9GAMM|nr:hypothetical protein D0544_01345 [Aestuariirhabdus litorea]
MQPSFVFFNIRNNLSGDHITDYFTANLFDPNFCDAILDGCIRLITLAFFSIKINANKSFMEVKWTTHPPNPIGGIDNINYDNSMTRWNLENNIFSRFKQTPIEKIII